VKYLQPFSEKETSMNKTPFTLWRGVKAAHGLALPGLIWEAVRRELGNPWNVRKAIEDWAERRWGRIAWEERVDGVRNC
jgi:hypothetical protein